MPPYFIENSALRLACYPQCGGKFFSLVERSTGTEFLLPPAAAYPDNSASAGFEDSDRGGFDECLPSVAACSAGPHSLAVPDHGELWRTSWEIQNASAAELSMSATCPLSELQLARKATLDGSAIDLHYRLTNTGRETRSWLWSAHPLLSVEPGDQIVLPDDINEARVECSLSGEWKSGDRISWPHASQSNGSHIDLSVVPAPDGITGNKLFTHVSGQGWCALHRKRARRVVMFRFDPRELPYLGIWICLGAWPVDRAPRQYTVALEPTTANCDSLASACENRTARWIEPGDSVTWDLRLEVLNEDWSPLAGVQKPML